MEILLQKQRRILIRSKFLIPVVLAVGAAGQACAGPVPGDTASYTLSEIVVSANRIGALVNAVPSAITLIPNLLVQLKPGSLVASALDGTSGLFLRSYGGGDALRSVSLRGMSAEHTLVLVDGCRVNSAQNGQIDFGILSSSNIDRVEVAKGGYSAMYGADAVGGVINIFTRRPSTDVAAGVFSTIGSTGFSASEVSIGGTTGGVGWTGLLRRERGSGDYSFKFSDGQSITTLRRNGGDFTSLNADARVEYAFPGEIRSWLSLACRDADRGVPGPVTDANTVSKARLADTDLRWQAGASWDLSPRLTAKVSSTFLHANERYNDPGIRINGEPLQSFSLERNWEVMPELQFAASPQLSGTAGFEFMRAWITGNEVKDALRWQESVFATTQHSFRFGDDSVHEVVVYPTVRYDRFSAVGGDISPRIGVNVGLLRLPELRLRSSYGKSYRVPTFNDLYWYAGGNPDLKPERSLSFDCGALSTLRFLGEVRLDVSYFSISTSDRIVWTPSSGSFWSPKNIGRVASRGVEAETRWTGFEGLLTLTLNSTWTDARKQSEDYPGDPGKGKHLIYTPGQTVNASAVVDAGLVVAYLQHSWVSFRYSTETNDRFLPSYAVTSAAIRYALKLGSVRSSFKMECSNIFNSSYQNVALYPMPLREFRGTLGVEL